MGAPSTQGAEVAVAFTMVSSQRLAEAAAVKATFKIQATKAEYLTRKALQHLPVILTADFLG